MEEKIYTIEDFKKEQKKQHMKEQIKNKANDVRNWFYNNKELVLVLGPAALGALTTGVKVVGRHANLRKEKDVKELYCYDRSLGHYWRLRRELSNAEWIEIDRRKKNGERLSDILNELRVLK